VRTEVIIPCQLILSYNKNIWKFTQTYP